MVLGGLQALVCLMMRLWQPLSDDESVDSAGGTSPTQPPLEA